MFNGEYYYCADEKGRVVIPAEYRACLKGKVFLARGFDKNIYVFDEFECAKLREKWSSLNDLSQPARFFKTIVFSGMVEVAPDGQGRVKVPQALLNYAGITKEVVLSGVQDRIEIWSKERWDMFMESCDLAKLAQELYSSQDKS